MRLLIAKTEQTEKRIRPDSVFPNSQQQLPAAYSMSNFSCVICALASAHVSKRSVAESNSVGLESEISKWDQIKKDVFSNINNIYKTIHC